MTFARRASAYPDPPTQADFVGGRPPSNQGGEYALRRGHPEGRKPWRVPPEWRQNYQDDLERMQRGGSHSFYERRADIWDAYEDELQQDWFMRDSPVERLSGYRWGSEIPTWSEVRQEASHDMVNLDRVLSDPALVAQIAAINPALIEEYQSLRDAAAQYAAAPRSGNLAAFAPTGEEFSGWQLPPTDGQPRPNNRPPHVRSPLLPRK